MSEILKNSLGRDDDDEVFLAMFMTHSVFLRENICIVATSIKK
jgi:hypothetical protein